MLEEIAIFLMQPIIEELVATALAIIALLLLFILLAVVFDLFFGSSGEKKTVIGILLDKRAAPILAVISVLIVFVFIIIRAWAVWVLSI